MDVLQALMYNPELKKDGNFAYSPSFLRESTLETIQLHQSAWWHRAQQEVGPENMVLAVVTNVDGTNTTSQKETIFIYLRLGNATAPGCFQPTNCRLIGIIPDLNRKECKFDDDEDFYRAKHKVFHDSINKIFEKFHEASHQ